MTWVVKQAATEHSSADVFAKLSLLRNFGLATADASGQFVATSAFARRAGTVELGIDEMNVLVTGRDRVDGVVIGLEQLMGDKLRYGQGRRRAGSIERFGLSTVCDPWEELAAGTKTVCVGVGHELRT